MKASGQLYFPATLPQAEGLPSPGTQRTDGGHQSQAEHCGVKKTLALPGTEPALSSQ
jgi:hypothetical protein